VKRLGREPSLRGLCSALIALLLGGAFLAVPAFASPGNGNNCGGPDTGAPGQGGDHTPCEPTTLPPTSPPATSPPATSPPATSPPVTTPTVPGAPPVPGSPDEPPVIPGALPVEVAGEQITIQEISNVLRRAFVAGEAVRLAGTAPAGCEATLHVDGAALGPIAATAAGAFDIGVDTGDLPAGRHVAEVFCSNPATRLMRTVFWVAAPQSSSNLFFVALGSLLVIYAIGWVGLRTLAGSSLVTSAATVGRTPRP